MDPGTPREPMLRRSQVSPWWAAGLAVPAVVLSKAFGGKGNKSVKSSNDDASSSRCAGTEGAVVARRPLAA